MSKQKDYSISLCEDFTHKKMQICFTDHRQGVTAPIPANEYGRIMKQLKKLGKQLKQK